MDDYLVNVPVKINIWIRPDCQKRQFEVLKKAKPSILFIQSDGGRNENEKKCILENRELIDNGIDWNCTVYRMYNDENRGLYETGMAMRRLIWSKVDRCIFLEDDLLPTVEYFQFCAELLEKYKDDERIECICGFNHLGMYDCGSADYFFSRQGSIWGTASWRRVAEKDSNFSYADDEYIMRLLKQRTKHNRMMRSRIIAYSKSKEYEGHIPGTEFFYEFNMYGQNRLQIIPKINMISNIGCTENSEHADKIEMLPKGIRRIFNSETFRLSFPLKHPDFVIPDIEYEKKRNRIMAYNHPLINGYRKLERGFRKLLSGDIEYIVKKIKKTKEK